MTTFRCRALALAAATSLAACSGEQPAPAPSPEPIASPSAAAAPALSSADRLAAAIAVAFPRNAVVQTETGDRYTFATHRLIDTPFGPVLASEGRVADPGHVSAGRIDLTYLAPKGTGFTIVERYPAAIEAGSFGEMSEWAVRTDLADVPTIAASGGFTGQGITCGSTVLTELRRTGPVETAVVRTDYDDSGSVEGEGAQTLEGAIVNPSRSGFDVRYTGSRQVTVHYARDGGKWVRQGADPLPEC